MIISNHICLETYDVIFSPGSLNPVSGPGALNPVFWFRGPSKQVGEVWIHMGCLLHWICMWESSKPLYNHSDPNIWIFHILEVIVSTPRGEDTFEKCAQHKKLFHFRWNCGNPALSFVEGCKEGLWISSLREWSSSSRGISVPCTIMEVASGPKTASESSMVDGNLIPSRYL